MEDCIFCKIIKGEIPSKKIYEDDILIVFMDINPNDNGHMLIVPKNHIVDFTDHYDRVLNKHSLDRLDMFRTVIGVSDTNIYESLSFERFKEVFCKIENLS